jgi:GTP cyclohydrolase I
METKLILTNNDISKRAAIIVSNTAILNEMTSCPINVFAIPRGGIPAAYALEVHSSCIFNYVSDVTLADLIIDDLVDSGATRDKYQALNPTADFVALYDKHAMQTNPWIVFPWEETAEAGIESHITRLLQYCGEDSSREGLLETPKRVAKAWSDWTAGYALEPKDVLKVFKDGSNGCDEMVIVKDIPFYSHCEHHMAPFFGTATVAYIPNGSIVGLSKLSRLVDVYAKRLQVQERLTNQIADSLMNDLGALGCGVLIKARHMCCESRGIAKNGHHTITSALRGVVKTQAETRAEFIALAK